MISNRANMRGIGVGSIDLGQVRDWDDRDGEIFIFCVGWGWGMVGFVFVELCSTVWFGRAAGPWIFGLRGDLVLS